jgi:YesN/AraC family two-component response regulator
MKMLRKTEMGNESISKDWWVELIDYIDANIGEPLTLGSLAKKSFYNPSYFSRIFKQKFGVSLTDYIAKKRVDMAIELLANNDIPLDEIIRRCGFADRSSFYHSFSKYKGKAPSEFRSKTSKK